MPRRAEVPLLPLEGARAATLQRRRVTHADTPAFLRAHLCDGAARAAQHCRYQDLRAMQRWWWWWWGGNLNISFILSWEDEGVDAYRP